MDVGTDHGYVPIYLMKNRLATHVIAMDINKGPLERAEEHIREYNLQDDIETRLSNGFSELKPDEADIAVLAGMGGELIRAILREGSHVTDGLKELVLSPHSEIDIVRRFLHNIGFKIISEEMLVDEGKFYTIIKAVKGNDRPYTEIEYKYGALLIEEKNDVLWEFLKKRRDKITDILLSLKNEQTKNAKIREEQLYKERMEINEIMEHN